MGYTLCVERAVAVGRASLSDDFYGGTWIFAVIVAFRALMLRLCIANQIRIIIFRRPSVLYIEQSGDVVRLLDHAVCGFQPGEIENEVELCQRFFSGEHFIVERLLCNDHR